VRQQWLRSTTAASDFDFVHKLVFVLMWSRISCEAAMALGTTASSHSEFVHKLCILMWSRIRCKAAMALGTTASSDMEFVHKAACLDVVQDLL